MKEIKLKNSDKVAIVDDDMYDELNKYNAAQSFLKANPNLLRLGAITTMIGVSQYISPSRTRNRVVVRMTSPAAPHLIIKVLIIYGFVIFFL